MRERYLLAVPSNATIRDLEATPPAYGGRGQKPRTPFEQVGGFALVRRERIGLVFQSGNLIPSWTAVGNVEAALVHSPVARRKRRERAEALLMKLGLAERLRSLPAELSAGERQRVAVARALVASPALVLADEPTGDVDPDTAKGIVSLLAEEVVRAGRTLVLATHGPPPEGLVTRTVRLEGGRGDSESE